MIHRLVSSGASFGGNSFQLEVGLRKADKINHVTVQWPCKECPEERFEGFAINQAYHLVQNSKKPKLLEYTSVKMGGAGGKMDHHQHHEH
jgi:hypothetical protein